MKFLIACALIAAMSQTAMAQMIPEKCQKLQVPSYTFEPVNNGNPYIDVVIRNDDPYTLTFATLYFDLLNGEHNKIGAGSVNIGRLLPGDREKVRIFYTLNFQQEGLSR